MMNRLIVAPTRYRRGITLPLIMFSLAVFAVFATMAIDTAYMQLVRTELRAAADAVAQGGAEALSRSQNVNEVFAELQALAAKNKVAGKGLAIAPGDLEFGRTSKNLDGTWSFNANQQPYTACRVTLDHGGSSIRPDVPLLLGSVLGVHSFSPTETATAAFSENDIVLVVDRSHSMCFDLTGVAWTYPPSIPTDPDEIAYPPHATESRWSSLALGVNLFLDIAGNIDSAQRIGLVTFGSTVGTSSYEYSITGRTFPAVALDQPISTNHTLIRDAIAARGADLMLGGTNLTAGIDAGINELEYGANARPYANKIMIVMTDGKWNEGGNPTNAAASAKQAGITVHTITFLDAADQTDMKKVAKFGGGRHYHASDEAALLQAFEDVALSLPVTLTK